MSSDNLEHDIITKPQFTALLEYFEKVLENMKDDDNLKTFRIDFTKLFHVFQSCYRESERRACKIRELMAITNIEVKKVKSENSEQFKAVNHLKATIKALETDIDELRKQRKELYEEVEKLKKDVENEDKIIQVNKKSLEKIQEFKHGPPEKTIKEHKLIRIDPIGKQNVASESQGRELVDSKVLATDLKILVADLKITRKKIKELKKEIEGKDKIIREYNIDFSETEKEALEANKKFLEIQKKSKIAVETCRKELEHGRRKYQEIRNDLVQVLDLNAIIAKENETKESVIEQLKSKVEELKLEKESAVRKSNLFEDHLAQSQIRIEELQLEVKTLQDQVNLLEIAASKNEDDISHVERDKKEQTAHEMVIENYKHQVTHRDKKLQEVVEELKENIETLKIAKEEVYAKRKVTTNLENEVRRLKKALKERCSDVKQLKEKLTNAQREINELTKEINAKLLKHQSVLEKKNKFHGMCTHMKLLNSELRKENLMLEKRQQYLVKILKEKDMEMERVVFWKRFIN